MLWCRSKYGRGSEFTIRVASTIDLAHRSRVAYAVIALDGVSVERIGVCPRRDRVRPECEIFALLGEPGDVFEDFANPCFYGAGPPFGAWIGIKIDLE